MMAPESGRRRKADRSPEYFDKFWARFGPKNFRVYSSLVNSVLIQGLKYIIGSCLWACIISIGRLSSHWTTGSMGLDNLKHCKWVGN